MFYNLLKPKGRIVIGYRAYAAVQSTFGVDVADSFLFIEAPMIASQEAKPLDHTVTFRTFGSSF
jgi:hypothetical protein